MKASSFPYDVGAWSEIQMVGISEDDLGFNIRPQLCLRYCFYSSVGANGHENGGFYGTVVCMENATAGFAALRSGFELEQMYLCEFGRESLI